MSKSEQETITAALKRWLWLLFRLGALVFISALVASYVHATMVSSGYELPLTAHWYLLFGLSFGVVIGWWAGGLQARERKRMMAHRFEDHD